MRKRFISPAIWQDEKFIRLSTVAKLLFIGLITVADDEGRLLANPHYLKGMLFPYDNGLTAERLQTARNEITTTIPSVQLYRVKEREIINLATWQHYQKPNHPSKSTLPPPPTEQHQAANSPQPQDDISPPSPRAPEPLLNPSDLTLEPSVSPSQHPPESIPTMPTSGYGGGEGSGIGLGSTAAGTSVAAPLNDEEERLALAAQLYEDTVGPLAPLVADLLRQKAAESRAPPEMIRRAFQEAARYNHRSWAYVEAVWDRLERGNDDGHPAQRQRDDKGRYTAGRVLGSKTGGGPDTAGHFEHLDTHFNPGTGRVERPEAGASDSGPSPPVPDGAPPTEGSP